MLQELALGCAALGVRVVVQIGTNWHVFRIFKARLQLYTVGAGVLLFLLVEGEG
jgi:hypothetical protein